MKTEFALLLATTLTLSLHAQVLPNDTVVDGRTIGEWGAEWYKSFMPCPTNDNPLRDLTGANALNCQPEGSVLFLAGVQFGDLSTATRRFVIPEGKHLFFPMLNVICGGDPGDPPTVEECRNAAAAFIINHTELHASIDGVPVANLEERRAQSPVFSMELPSCDNMFTVNNGFCISGLLDDLIADGYYVMVAPLPLGEHVINFGGTLGPPFGFQINITEYITVVPDPNQYVLPADAIVGGRTQAEWSAEWWKWSYSLSTNQHPLFDATGAWANHGQPDGPVFFLAGVFVESGRAARSFAVPEGKHLFLPLVNLAPDCVDTPPPCTVEQLRDHAAASLSLVTGLHASIDSVKVPSLFDHRVASPLFNFEFLTPDNIFSWFIGRPFTGLNDPIVSDGYWLMIKPLPPGRHVVNFGATVGPPVNFTIDITDTIMVVPATLKQKVEELLAKVATTNLSAKRKRALEITLLRAGDAFENGNLRAGIRHLRIFQHQVRARLAWAYPDLAQDLISGAQAIMERARRDLKHDRHEDDDGDNDDDGERNENDDDDD